MDEKRIVARLINNYEEVKSFSKKNATIGLLNDACDYYTKQRFYISKQLFAYLEKNNPKVSFFQFKQVMCLLRTKEFDKAYLLLKKFANKKSRDILVCESYHRIVLLCLDSVYPIIKKIGVKALKNGINYIEKNQLYSKHYKIKNMFEELLLINVLNKDTKQAREKFKKYFIQKSFQTNIFSKNLSDFLNRCLKQTPETLNIAKKYYRIKNKKDIPLINLTRSFLDSWINKEINSLIKKFNLSLIERDYIKEYYIKDLKKKLPRAIDDILPPVYYKDNFAITASIVTLQNYINPKKETGYVFLFFQQDKDRSWKIVRQLDFFEFPFRNSEIKDLVKVHKIYSITREIAIALRKKDLENIKTYFYNDEIYQNFINQYNKVYAQYKPFTKYYTLIDPIFKSNKIFSKIPMLSNSTLKDYKSFNVIKFEHKLKEQTYTIADFSFEKQDIKSEIKDFKILNRFLDKNTKAIQQKSFFDLFNDMSREDNTSDIFNEIMVSFLFLFLNNNKNTFEVKSQAFILLLPENKAYSVQEFITKTLENKLITIKLKTYFSKNTNGKWQVQNYLWEKK